MLFWMCLLACVLFTLIMVGGVLVDKEGFFHEYAPAVQQRYLALHPDRAVLLQKKSGVTAGLLAAKLGMSLLFLAILTGMVLVAGAVGFWQSALYAYCIWFCVNWYDVFVLDMGVFAHWRKCRLPGTEDMDSAYVSNRKKHLLDGVYGLVIGLPISFACGALTALLQ